MFHKNKVQLCGFSTLILNPESSTRNRFSFILLPLWSKWNTHFHWIVYMSCNQ